MTKTYKEAKRWKIGIEKWLKEHLRLTTCPEKTEIINLTKKRSKFLGIELKAVRKSGKKERICRSYVGKQEQTKIFQKLKVAIRKIIRIHKFKVAQAIFKTRSKILGIQNYYEFASNVSRDFNRINHLLYWSVKKLKKKRAWAFNKLMKCLDHKNYSKYTIIAAKCKPQLITYDQKCPYDNHDVRLNPFIENQVKSLRNARNMGYSIEYADNRISKYIAQNGKDAITGFIVTAENVHCHHIIPRSKGGNDNFRNLVIVSKTTHDIIHNTNSEIVQNYIRVCRLNKKRRERLMQLIKLVQSS